MEQKKSDKVNLENQRSIFLQIGFVIALVLMLIAFEWNSTKTIHDLGELPITIIDEEIIPITRTEKIKPPIPKVIEVINIVADNIEIKEELEIENTESNEDIEINIPELDDEEEISDVPFIIVEEMPIFTQGNVHTYITKNIKYPEICKENNIQGKVYVQFVVNEKGKVSNVKILKGVDPNLDKEALRVINNLPDYIPGKQRGKCVKVSYVVYVNFILSY